MKLQKNSFSEDIDKSFFNAGKHATLRAALAAWNVIETVFGEAVRLPISIDKISKFYNMTIHRARSCIVKTRWTYFRDTISDDRSRLFEDFENRHEASVIVAKKLCNLGVYSFFERNEERVFGLALLIPIFPLKFLLRSGIMASDIESVFNVPPKDITCWASLLSDGEKLCSCQRKNDARYKLEAKDGAGKSISGCALCLEADNIEVYNTLKRKQEFMVGRRIRELD